MKQLTHRKERLHRLIDFARVYRGWNRIQTAKALGRDSTKLYPNTDNPKMDVLVGLSNILEWSVGDVVEYIWSGDGATHATNGATFDSLDAAAAQAHRDGQHARMAELARQMYGVAATPEQRARACNREHGAWDGLGRYTKALEAACRGLRENPLPTERRHQLQGNLANTHYTLWELASALAHAHVIVEWYETHPPANDHQQKRQAFAWYVRGHTHRRLAGRGGDDSATHRQTAKSDLTAAFDAYTRLADALADDRLAGIANTCRGGLLEVDVELGLLDASVAVELCVDSLDAVVDPETVPAGDWLESHGWWCVFGANIALRRLEGRRLQHSLAVFTNKALEIADRMDNWALRERVFTMQYALHEKLIDTTGLDLPYQVDDEDKRLITGTMGRFPSFRDTGWRIFRAAKVVDSAARN
jgi:hypothetical protein